MFVPSILPSSIQSTRPSKRKIIKTIYTTEKFSRKIQNDLPENMRGAAKYVSETCNRVRTHMTKVN